MEKPGRSIYYFYPPPISQNSVADHFVWLSLSLDFQHGSTEGFLQFQDLGPIHMSWFFLLGHGPFGVSMRYLHSKWIRMPVSAQHCTTSKILVQLSAPLLFADRPCGIFARASKAQDLSKSKKYNCVHITEPLIDGSFLSVHPVIQFPTTFAALNAKLSVPIPFK